MDDVRPQQLIADHREGRCCFVEDLYRRPLPLDFCDRRAFVELIGRHHGRTFPVCWRHYRWAKRTYPEAKFQTVDWLIRLVNRVTSSHTDLKGTGSP